MRLKDAAALDAILARPGYHAREQSARAAQPSIEQPPASNKASARPNRRDWVTLEIPFPPTTNHDKRPDGRGGQILTAETKAFRAEVAALILAMRSPWVHGRVCVVITLYPPDRRAYDIDNRIKPTLDALQAAGVFQNDRQVKRIVIAEADVSEGGKAAVSVQAGA